MIAAVRILIGLGTLTMGRRLFWLFVGGVGFVLGISVASQLVATESTLMTLLVGLAVGAAGAFLAVALQRVALGIGGFVGGGLIASNLASLMGIELAAALLFLIGGVAGFLLITLLFEWTLIVLSSATGAMLIIQTFEMRPLLAGLLFLALAAFGIVVQAQQKQQAAQKSSN